MKRRAALVGYGGMGQAIDVEWKARGHEVTHRLRSTDSVDALVKETLDLAFEFTSPDSAPAVLGVLAERGIPTVSGTTGFDPEPLGARFDAAGVPLLHAANFSLLVQLTFRLSERVGRVLHRLPEYDVSIVERHHTRKRDAPSGTARELRRRIEATADRTVEVFSLRQGQQPGEHRVIVEGAAETLEIVHRARSRQLFAQGAVAAAEWLLGAGRQGLVPFSEFVDTVLEESEGAREEP